MHNTEMLAVVSQVGVWLRRVKIDTIRGVGHFFHCFEFYLLRPSRQLLILRERVI